jgi:hypothetical protein
MAFRVAGILNEEVQYIQVSFSYWASRRPGVRLGFDTPRGVLQESLIGEGFNGLRLEKIKSLIVAPRNLRQNPFAFEVE